MKLTIPVKALSVNQAYTGRRFKTGAYDDFTDQIVKTTRFGYYSKDSKLDVYVAYVFHVTNYNFTDVGNLEKPLTDVLVQRGYFNDDRYVKCIFVSKAKCGPGNEKIEVYISNDAEEYREVVCQHLQQT